MQERLCRLVRMDVLADARGILTAVCQSDWKRPAGRPQSSHLLVGHSEE